MALLAVIFLLSLPAQADPVTCTQLKLRLGQCTIHAEDSGQPPAANGPAPASAPGGAAPTVERRCVRHSGKEVPCTKPDGGEWSDQWDCWVSKLKKQPPADDPIWEGHTDGAIYYCDIGAFQIDGLFWAPEPPVTAVQVDPAVLARQAFGEMNLRAGQIGIVPRPGGMGIIGLPQWMWIADPGPQTTDGQSKSVSAGGVTVTVNARLRSVVWDMGDGNQVTCWTKGTPYEDSFGKQMSPDCGYRYQKQGTYTVTATMNWDVRWSSTGGQTGVIPFQVQNSTTVTMAEIQVVNGRGGGR